MEVNITVLAKNPKEQKLIGNLLTEVEQKFPEAGISVTPKSKKLVPEEVLLIIAINIASQISAEVLFRILDRLWKEFSKRNIQIELSPLDKTQEKAENYLKARHLVNYKIVKREDKGLYAYLIYQTVSSVHVFHISKSDLEIIKYEEKSFT